MDLFNTQNKGRATGDVDPRAISGGIDYAYYPLPLGLATNGACQADGSNGPTVSVTGTTNQSQTVQHAFAIATTKDYDHVNIMIPNDYMAGGTLQLVLLWKCADATGTKKACWEHTWRVLSHPNIGVFDAAGTSGTMVKTTVAGTTLRLVSSVLDCPAAVAAAAKAGDLLHITFGHDYTQAENPGNTVDLLLATLKYQRA